MWLDALLDLLLPAAIVAWIAGGFAVLYLAVWMITKSFKPRP